MKDMKKIIVMMAVMAMGMGFCYAEGPARVPAYRGVIERVQPDGDTLRTYLRGDERMHWMMTEDGWQIIETAKGWFMYAKLNRQGQAVATRRKAHNEADRRSCEKRWLDKHGIKKTIG